MRPHAPGFLVLAGRWLLALGLGLALGAAPAPLDRVTLQLKWHHQFQFAGYYAAQAQGYYRDAGLEVNILEAEPGIDVVKELETGHAQYGVGDSSLLLARRKGAPVVVLAAIFQHSPMILMARARSGIATVQDLAGKRVMIEDKADELIAYLRQEGVPEGAMVLMKHTFNPDDLIKGKVDCMSAYGTDEPFFLRNAHENLIEFSPRMGGIDFYGDNLFTSEAEIQTHPARARAFREASLKGWKYAMQHQDELIGLIIARYGERRGRDYLHFEALKMVQLLQPGMVEMGYMYPGRWQHIVDTYADLGLLPRDFRLEGFLYDQEAGIRQTHRRLVLAIGLLVVLGGVLGGVALVFLRLNLRLKKEIATRVQAVEERARLESQLQQAQKMKSLGLLAGGVAHDMNNVLGAILGFAESNLEAQAAGTRAHHAFDTIAKAALRGGRMVRSLLSFARQRPAEERELDLNAVLREEVQILAHTTLAKVQLQLDLAPDLLPVLGDPDALTNALMNLCVNAVDAMTDQGVLTLRTRNVGADAVEVQVEDTGCGMPREVLERALDPFFTTKPEGKGTGLGLTMVYGIVEAHGGRLEILSAPGDGTCVKLRFPACRAAARAAAEEPEAHAGSGKAGLQVLVVDDDELFRNSVQELLEVLGHKATPAASGEEALALVAGGARPDVMMLDLNMPGLGGADTLQRLRALLPLVPIVVATGRADQAALDLVEAHQHVTLIPKPFRMKELQEHLEPLGRGGRSPAGPK
jgi:signal transduction histidine kinase